MKTIHLKMPRDGHGQDQLAGQRGDHRMHEIVVPLPRSPTQIQSCIALFLLDDQQPIISPLITRNSTGDRRLDDNAVRIVLWQQLTQCRVLRVQLACYGDIDGLLFIANTPISERILFRNSIPGELDDLPELSDNPGILPQLLAWTHRHPNMPILDALTEDCLRGGAAPAAISNCDLNDILNKALKTIGGSPCKDF